jgi:penicillin G amidase
LRGAGKKVRLPIDDMKTRLIIPQPIRVDPRSSVAEFLRPFRRLSFCPAVLLPAALLWASSLPAAPANRGTSPPPAYGKIELVHDRWGIPHLFSETDAGALYGLGYATAQERAFQMHFNLRIIQGRLAEIVGARPAARRGETAVDNDRKMRTFGFYRAAKAMAATLPPETRALLEAYCQGVNDGIAAQGEKLHPLFTQYGLIPEPWTPADCLASWWHLAQFFATDGTRELLQFHNQTAAPEGTRIAANRGAARLTPPQPTAAWFDDAAAVVGRNDATDDWLARIESFMKAQGLSHAAPTNNAPTGPKFSHAWVVGGQKTTTGSAVLVSDPQTPVRNPSLWIEFHLCGKTFNARGIGVPGSPILIIGWNERVAWGCTALGADQADLFRLQTDAGHPHQYCLDGAWQAMDIIHETVKIKDQPAEDLAICQTCFGPVITPFAFPSPGDPEVALKRVPVFPTRTETIEAAFGMMRASNLASFSQALTHWQFPSLNMIAGDRDGNIGYWLLAAIPVRSPRDPSQGNAALDGRRHECDWQGFIPHDLLPQVINPRRGWIASANHRPVASFYPLPLGLSTGSGGHTIRSWRLYELLNSRERFTPKDVLAIHYDSINPARRDIVRAGLHLRDRLKRTLSPDASQALQLLDAWFAHGAKSDLNEAGCALAGEINTFFRFVNTPLAGKFGGGETGLSRFLRDLEGRLAGNPPVELDREEQDFIDQALALAWQSARQQWGDNPERWNQNARDQVRRRRLGWFDSLDGFGSLAAAGDLTMPGLTCVDGGTLKSQAAQSYTQFVPLHDIDSARSLLPPGHADSAEARARTSTLDEWANGELHPAPLSRKAVSQIAAETVVLSSLSRP